MIGPGDDIILTRRSYDYRSGGAQAQNVKSGRVYVFGDADVEEDEVGEDVHFEMSEVCFVVLMTSAMVATVS